ncbi:MAG: hypothetical protein ACLUOF_05000 [Ruminococcus sp.]
MSIAVVLVLLFFFPKPILLAVLLLEIALPLLAHSAPDGHCCNDPFATSAGDKQCQCAACWISPIGKASAVFGVCVEMTLEMQNLLFHTQKSAGCGSVFLPGKALMEFTPDMCGEWFIRASVCSAWTSLGSVRRSTLELFCRVKVMRNRMTSPS